jgi:hypothetical protein
MLAACAAALVLTACASSPPAGTSAFTRDLAGRWSGSMDTGSARGRATMVLQPNGRYAGYVRVAGQDRPFRGTIVTLGPQGGRYAGSDGDGSVTLRREARRTVLELVRDGDGGRATFERAR